MSQELLHDNSIRVTEYSLIDFTFAVADLGARGFVPTLLNGSHPEGGMGSWYTCIMVARDAYRIDKDGNHVNAPKQEAETSKESALKDDSSEVSGSEGTDVPVVATNSLIEDKTTKTVAKRTPTKKTT